MVLFPFVVSVWIAIYGFISVCGIGLPAPEVQSLAKHPHWPFVPTREHPWFGNVSTWKQLSRQYVLGIGFDVFVQGQVSRISSLMAWGAGLDLID